MFKTTPAFSILGLILLGAGWASVARSQEGDPSSRIARLAYVQGPVSFQPAGTQDWVAAPINRPLTTGDTLYGDQDSRAELQLGDSVMRLGSGSELNFVNLSDAVTQVQLTAGTLVLRVRDLDDNETYEVDTPNLAFSVLRPGLYRIAVDASSNTTTVTVRSGQGEVTGNGAAYTMRNGDSDVYSGTDALVVDSLSPSQDDDFDAWSAERDRRSARDVSAQYVSSDVVGYEDLDDYGSWSNSPEYGHVWYPSQVEAGWAPYHSGHWAYIAPWGYTWVDDKPWGFAPFHYGRWVYAGNAWGWCPAAPRPRYGGPYVRPVYAPALVAWVGAGAGIAWFALGPREVYVPSYHVSQDYVRNINISNTTVNRTVINNVYNTTIINNKTVNVTYINRGAPGAVAATSAQAFASAQPVQKNRFAFDQQALRGAQVRPSAPALVPTREAVIGANRESVRPPPQFQGRPVIARTAPPPPPVSVDRRIEALRGNGGRPLSPAEVRQIQPATPAARPVAIHVAPSVAPVAVANAPMRRPPVSNGQNNVPNPAPNNPVSNAAVNGPRAGFNPNMPINRPAPAAVHATELPAPQRPSSPAAADSALERQQLQQQQQLRAQQDQERLKMQQQQELQHQQAARQQADQSRAQDAERQRQIQAQQQQQHAQQEEAAQRAQQQELARQQAARQQADQARAADLERQHQLQTQQMQQRQIAQQEQLQQQQRQLQQQAQERQQQQQQAQQAQERQIQLQQQQQGQQAQARQREQAEQQQNQKRPVKPDENKRPP